MPEHPAVTILVVDDDEGHCELIRRNLRRGGVSNPVVTLHRGKDALAYVRERGRDRHANEPERLLMLLDINMPGGLNGVDVLREIKADPVTRKIPVIILTTTDDPREIGRCYDLGCSIYITKPVEAQAFIDAIKRLGLLVSIVSLAPMRPDGAPTPLLPGDQP
ncbi:MAG: response regulator [Rhodospirillales bacterium]|nr:response regulator [Rhodospirillales bacterium]